MLYFCEILRAKAQVDNVLGAKRDVTYEDLTKLEYINCVFKESLRKWPPAGEFSRFSTEDVELEEGLLIPKNTWIIVNYVYIFFNFKSSNTKRIFFKFSPYVLGRMEKYFPDPEKFQPERFLKGSPEADINK
jgi:cholesterol 24(S)-hydroxylase